jgi:LAS superfamily LD-carboxypeptidase LdcB
LYYAKGEKMAKDKYILVNKENPYNPENYKDVEYVFVEIPIKSDGWLDDDVVVRVENEGTSEEIRWTQVKIEKSTYESFYELKEWAMRTFGLEIEIKDAQRCEERQAKYFNNAANDPNRGLKYAEEYIAKPGYSEHQTGYAVDYSLEIPKINAIKHGLVKKVIRKLSRPIAFEIVNTKAAELGLAVRYPLFGKKYTGYRYERWHLSNVGDPILASYLRAHNMPLEYFYANASKLEKSYERFAENFVLNHPDFVEPDDGEEMGDK